MTGDITGVTGDSRHPTVPLTRHAGVVGTQHVVGVGAGDGGASGLHCLDQGTLSVLRHAYSLVA